MGELYEKLLQDVRFVEGLKACINCGTCTAICPAAEFYNYDPRLLTDAIQTRDDTVIYELLKSELIWYCGECMSCKTRCPRGNTPGLIIMALRSLSQELGYFTESEKGRQQLAIKRIIGESILKTGYCVFIENVVPELHPEQGPVWEWELNHLPQVLEKVSANYKGDGPGALRQIPSESLDELKQIFDVTGATERLQKIEHFSQKKAKEMGLSLDQTLDNEYIKTIYTVNNPVHLKDEQ